MDNNGKIRGVANNILYLCQIDIHPDPFLQRVPPVFHAHVIITYVCTLSLWNLFQVYLEEMSNLMIWMIAEAFYVQSASMSLRQAGQTCLASSK